MFGTTANGPAFVGRTFVPSYDLTAPLFPITGVSGNQYLIQTINTLGSGSALPSE